MEEQKKEGEEGEKKEGEGEGEKKEGGWKGFLLCLISS